MNFYHILFALKKGFNRNLTWYENLFVKFYNNTIAKLIAKFLKIKGNTLVFNQLVQNGNFVDTSNWGAESGVSFSVASNIATMVTTTSNNGIYQQPFPITANHSYLVKLRVKFSSTGKKLRVVFQGSGVGYLEHTSASTNWEDMVGLVTPSSSYASGNLYVFEYGGNGTTINLADFNIVDLTKLNSSAITDATSFRTYFSLPYYAYNTGSLLSFNGSGLKTTGKNLCKAFTQYDVTTLYVIVLRIDADIKPDTTYTFSFIGVQGNICYANENLFTTQPYITFDGERQSITLTTKSDLGTKPSGGYGIFKNGVTQPRANNFSDIQVEFGSSASDYEPYTSSTINLPTLNYFPTGMKSAGNVYDELTESKATVRVGSVDLGNLSWTNSESQPNRFSSTIADVKMPPNFNTKANILCSIFETDTSYNVNNGIKDNTIAIHSVNNYVWVYDTSYSDATTFKNAMSGVMLYYELATPTETTIDPPLDLSYEIEWGGTEQLLPENTSTPTTSPILADMHYPDGDRADQYFTYREIEKTNMRNNRALSIILGRSVNVENPEEPLNILLKGE